MKKSSAILGGIQTLALAATLASATAFAASQPANNTTAAPAAAVAPASILSKITVSAFGQYVGTSIGRPSQYIVDEYGRDTKTQQLVDGGFAFGYKITDTIIAGFNANMLYRPVAGQDIRIKDPAFKLINKKFVNVGNFNLFSDIRFYPGVTAASKKAGMLVGIRTTHVANYEIPNSKLTLGAFGIVRYNVTGSEAAKDALKIDAYFAPNLSYQISPTVAATLAYELDGNYLANATSITDWVSGGTDLQAGVSVDVTPNVNLNPYLQVSTGGKINLDSTSVGMYFSAKFL